MAEGREEEKGEAKGPTEPEQEGAPPLVKGRPLSREESLERMYERYRETFEALAK